MHFNFYGEILRGSYLPQEQLKIFILAYIARLSIFEGDNRDGREWNNICLQRC